VAELLAKAAGHYNRRELADAGRLCESILQLEPRHPQVLHLAGLVAMARGDFRASRSLLERSVASRPSPEVLVDLAGALIKTWNLDEAIQCCREALTVMPDYAEAHYNLGTALHWKLDFTEAAESLAEAVRLKPDFFAARVNLGRSLLGCGKYAEAQREFEHVFTINENHPGALLFYGISCHEQGEFDKAVRYYDRAHALRPKSTDVLGNMANAYRDVGNFARSDEIFERVLELTPNYPEARNDYSHALLARGQFGRGWELYESRWEANRWKDHLAYKQPPWKGEPLAGKRLLVWGEQGIGDQMMFGSLLPELLCLQGKCTVVVEKKLVPLFERSFPSAEIIERRTDAHAALLEAPYDYQVPIASLGQHFRRKFADFPQHTGYLKADEGKVRAWRERLAAMGPGKKVAVSWRGGFVGTRRHLRSIDLEAWLPILQTPGMEFISLQYTEDAQAEIEALREKHGVVLHHWPEVIEDYDETAALVCALDRVVSVCTALIHLTGALGRPAWILVPAVPEWRYMREGNRMPWYPSVELFRQDRIGAWDGVIGRLAGALGRFADGA
jgi:tetratricopeptide (TPR) repeat protein/ADP-heptose:LPS heptosyltransferase